MELQYFPLRKNTCISIPHRCFGFGERGPALRWRMAARRSSAGVGCAGSRGGRASFAMRATGGGSSPSASASTALSTNGLHRHADGKVALSRYLSWPLLGIWKVVFHVHRTYADVLLIRIRLLFNLPASCHTWRPSIVLVEAGGPSVSRCQGYRDLHGDSYMEICVLLCRERMDSCVLVLAKGIKLSS